MPPLCMLPRTARLHGIQRFTLRLLPAGACQRWHWPAGVGSVPRGRCSLRPPGPSGPDRPLHPHLLRPAVQTASADQVLAAPKVASEGVFGNFRVPPHGAGHEWVVSGMLPGCREASPPPVGVLGWPAAALRPCPMAGRGVVRAMPPTLRLLTSCAAVRTAQALPNWSVLTLAGHPVALMVENCADVARIRDASAAKVSAIAGRGRG